MSIQSPLNNMNDLNRKFANSVASREKKAAHYPSQTLAAHRVRSFADLLALGFASSTGMWTIGYLCRMPGTAVPAPALLADMLALLFLGGLATTARTDRSVWAGFLTGLIAGGFNLLILGSLGHDLTTDHRMIAYAVISVPAALAISAILGLLGAVAGRWLNPARRQKMDGIAALTATTALATLVLVLAGGMVTGLNAGLSVPDWPDTFHYGMFVFPLSHMTGGVYYEHTHRLLATLVGLGTLVQTIYILLSEHRRWVKSLATAALLMVVAQGLLGGLRVTGHLTLAQARSHMDPSTTLAIVHGVFGQLFFGVLVALAAICSRSWRAGPQSIAKASARLDRTLAWSLVALLTIQLTLGSVLRHIGVVLAVHISVAVVVLLLCLFVGVRAWGMNPNSQILQRVGLALISVVTLQVLLGVAAVVAIGGQGPLTHPSMGQAIVTTAHQVTGAILLAMAVLTACWFTRLHRPLPMRELGL